MEAEFRHCESKEELHRRSWQRLCRYLRNQNLLQQPSALPPSTYPLPEEHGICCGSTPVTSKPDCSCNLSITGLCRGRKNTLCQEDRRHRASIQDAQGWCRMGENIVTNMNSSARANGRTLCCAATGERGRKPGSSF